MEEAGLLLDSFSTTLTIPIGIATTVVAVFVLWAVARSVDEASLIAVLFGLAIGVCGFAFGYNLDMRDHIETTRTSVEQHYGIQLLDQEGSTAGSDILRGEGYPSVQFRHGEDFYSDARLDKFSEGDSLRFVLMFNPGEDSSNMEEFDEALIEDDSSDHEEVDLD